MGDLSVEGNLKGVRSLVEPLQVGMENGAKRALIPLENKRSFMEVTADVMEHVDPVFFGDPKTAALKSSGIELVQDSLAPVSDPTSTRPPTHPSS